MRWTNLPEFESPPSGWRVAPLRTEVNFVFGQSPDSEHYNECGDGIAFLQGNADFTETHPVTRIYTTESGKQCAAADTLISVRAPVGELCRADRVYALGRGLAALRPIRMDSDFFFYAMHRWKRPLLRAAQGSTFDAVTARHFSQLQCVVPPDCEQRRIARALKRADEQIVALGDQVRRAERVAIALDQAHFGAASKTARFPYEYGTARTIPRKWASAPLGRLAEVTSGITINQDRAAVENRVRYLTVVNVYRGRIDLTEERYLEWRQSEAESKRLNCNDILVVEGHANPGEIGRAAIVSEREAGMSFQNHLFRVRLSSEDRIRAQFLVRALNSERIRRHWAATCNTSSGLSTINRTALRRLVVPLPQPQEQDVIYEQQRAAEDHIASLRQQLLVARRVKKSLLQNLLTGRIRLTS